MQESVKSQLLSLSFVQEFKNDSRERCWVDGLRCPYGSPEGQFELRPQKFCIDCQKIPGIIEEIAELCEPEDEELTLAKWLAENKPITLSKALANLLANKELEFDEDERRLLKAVSKMLMLECDDDMDSKVYYAKDLEDLA